MECSEGYLVKRKEVFSDVRRIVVKVGTNVLTSRDGKIDRRQIRNLCNGISEIMGSKCEVVLVSSGAIVTGTSALGLKQKPGGIQEEQAAASVGQSRLMHIYNECFNKKNRIVGQVLLTQADLRDRKRYLNARNTIITLLNSGVIPVVNENDAVAVDELYFGNRFGDNDILSALVTNLIGAQLLIILTDVDGLLSGKDGKLIGTVEKITPSVEKHVKQKKSCFGKGGMLSKIRAARIVTGAGEKVVIANGSLPGVLRKILCGENIGTLFLPGKGKIAERKRWIAFTLEPRGILKEIELIGKKAKSCSFALSTMKTSEKNSALKSIASGMEKNRGRIMNANERDVVLAKKKGRSKAFIDRLRLTPSRFGNMIDSIMQIASLPDPVGEVIKTWKRPNGLEISKVRVPLGVIGIIYEARPNVSVDASCLCLKAGNCVILRGGADAINSNIAIVEVIEESAGMAGVPSGAVQIIRDTTHEGVLALLRLDSYIDLIIPRGGENLIRTVVENSTIPVIKHYKGICHIFIDCKADLKMAEKICFNAKVQRPGVCNAMETMLVHKDIAKRFLKPVLARFKKAGVELRGCPEVRKIMPSVKKAVIKDWSTEYLDMILSVKVVTGIEEAVNHINTYGSGHSDSIVTSDYNNAKRFAGEIDSAVVFINASTRFTDGGEFGFGAEIGISTNKLHARGPMALEELTSYKYVIYGDGQIRE